MRKKNKIWSAGLVICLLLSGILLVFGSCRKTTVPLEIPQLVKAAAVNGYQGLSSVTYPGKIKAASYVKLAFRVAGPIKSVYVNAGQKVKKGQLLAELDPRDYKLQFDAARAEYTQVKGESGRIIELYRLGSVPVNEYDKAVAAEQRITALYEARRNALNDTRLKAPFDGYIQNKYFDAPEIVAQGTPVLSMIDNDYLEVNVSLPTGDFIRRGDFISYEATPDVYPGSVLPLELLDIEQGANYNQLFTARFRLKKTAAISLAPGMSVTVTIRLKPLSGELTSIPVSALFEKAGRSYVWLYSDPDRTIRMTSVEVQQMMKDGTVIVRSPLRQGQTVISAGVNELRDGQKVRLLPPVPASNVGGLL